MPIVHHCEPQRTPMPGVQLLSIMNLATGGIWAAVRVMKSTAVTVIGVSPSIGSQMWSWALTTNPSHLSGRRCTNDASKLLAGVGTVGPSTALFLNTMQLNPTLRCRCVYADGNRPDAGGQTYATPTTTPADVT